MNTAPRNHRYEDTAVDLSVRPPIDSMNPVELEIAAAGTDDDDTLLLANAVKAQRVRAASIAAGAAAFLAIIVAGGVGAIAKGETARALDRVHQHVAAANAALPPAAAIEILPRAVAEPIAPAPESTVREAVAPIPQNGGTPASVFVRPGSKKHRHK